MAAFKVNLKTEGALFNAANREAIENEEIRAHLTWASKQLEASVAKLTPVNTGATRGSIFSQVRGVAMGHGEAIVSMPVEHAEALESGSKPHWPPSAPIELWVAQKFRDKGGSIRAAVKQTGRSKQAGIRSIAFLVARAISRRGTRAYRMFAKSVASLDPAIKARWQDTVDRIAKRLSE